VKLELYRKEDSQSNVAGDVAVELYLLSQGTTVKSFVEGNNNGGSNTTAMATWNNRGGEAWTTAGGDFSTLLSSTLMDPGEDIDKQLETMESTAAWVAAVQAIVDGTTGVSSLNMLLKLNATSEGETNTRRPIFFYSDDQTTANAAYAPRLTIEYVPETSAGLLAALGLAGAAVFRRRRVC
jgi:MYXO-CTERM domain-containing protein